MICCVWYPSGGFGHFINAILSLHGEKFTRPQKQLTFGNNGNSHNLDVVAPKYFHSDRPYEYKFDFDQDKNYSVLIDNGINDESTQFRQVFNNSHIIKICYTDTTWPIVIRTMVEKAMNLSFESVASLGNAWDVQEPWAQREKYFLMLRNHNLRFSWKPEDGCSNLLVDDLLDYQQLFNKLQSFGINLKDFKGDWAQWKHSNRQFIDPVVTGNKIMNSVDTKQSIDLSDIKDLWTQAVVYYFIWIRYQFEVPHNDYSNWFTNTTDIVKMLEEHGVDIDSH